MGVGLVGALRVTVVLHDSFLLERKTYTSVYVFLETETVYTRTACLSRSSGDMIFQILSYMPDKSARGGLLGLSDG